MRARFHSLGDYGAILRALIVIACAIVALPAGNSPAELASPAALTGPIDPCVEQIEAANHPAAPIVRFDRAIAEDLRQEAVEFVESTDDDETEHCSFRWGVAALACPTGRSESSADQAQALTPFRLRAFSTRGSPLA